MEDLVKRWVIHYLLSSAMMLLRELPTEEPVKRMRGKLSKLITDLEEDMGG